MASDRLQRRIQANSQVVADGLEKLQEDLLAIFNSHLDRIRLETIDRDDTHVAMLETLIKEMGTLRAGLQGLSVQIAELMMQIGEAKQHESTQPQRTDHNP